MQEASYNEPAKNSKRIARLPCRNNAYSHWRQVESVDIARPIAWHERFGELKNLSAASLKKFSLRSFGIWSKTASSTEKFMRKYHREWNIPWQNLAWAWSQCWTRFGTGERNTNHPCNHNIYLWMRKGDAFLSISSSPFWAWSNCRIDKSFTWSFCACQIPSP